MSVLIHSVRARRPVAPALFWLGLLLLALACRTESESSESQAAAKPEPKAHELPPLDLRDDTPGLLLTYVDERGDFHVVQKTSDVPKEHKQKVRVVVDTNPAGTKELVYVTDLTMKKADGSYRVATMARSAWDEIGAERRKVRMEALAPSASAPPKAEQGGDKPPAELSGAKVVAIVYGADWCKPCHDAEAYLQARGVTVIKKDVDNNEIARNEMQHKLERANMGGASIPIIDIMGQLLVGFSPQALDRAIKTARNAKTL